MFYFKEGTTGFKKSALIRIVSSFTAKILVRSCFNFLATFELLFQVAADFELDVLALEFSHPMLGEQIMLMQWLIMMIMMTIEG